MTHHAAWSEAWPVGDPTERRATCRSFAHRPPALNSSLRIMSSSSSGAQATSLAALLPGLFRLAQAGLLPERYRIIATSRGNLTDDGFREGAKAAVEESGGLPSQVAWRAFASRLSFASPDRLVDAVAGAEVALGNRARKLFYLSVPPVAFAGIVSMLGASGLSEDARIILEKPFGTDLASARALNETVHAAFDENRIFRIDHFLGKETVQNILALRFANGIFEPIWNRDHIEHVQIDVPETLSIGTRAAFYEKTGAYRDMIVTHLLQVLGFVAMEPPTSFSAKALLDETAKVAESLRPIGPEDVVYGQYAGYRDEDGVAADSQTETFVAARVSIDNWRWAGVPFYLRTGKRMAEKRQVVTIAFRDPPRRMFGSSNGFGPNELVFELGDPARISTQLPRQENGRRQEQVRRTELIVLVVAVPLAIADRRRQAERGRDRHALAGRREARRSRQNVRLGLVVGARRRSERQRNQPRQHKKTRPASMTPTHMNLRIRRVAAHSPRIRRNVSGASRSRVLHLYELRYAGFAIARGR